MSGLLTPELLANIGRSSPPQREYVTRRDIRKYAVATGNRQAKYLRGDVAPPMFHIPLFWDVVELDELTPDGVSVDSLLPTFPLTRAMAGGLKITYHQPVLPGTWLTSVRTLDDIYEKTGRSGPLIFYRLVQEIKDEKGQLVIVEETTRILR